MSETTASKSNEMKSYFKVIIMLLIMFGGSMLPPFGSMTEAGMRVLATFIGLLFGWCTIGIILPCLVGMLSLSLCELCSITTILQGVFATDNLILVLMFYLLIDLMNKAGVSKFFGSWALSRKFIQGKPWLFSWVFIISCFITAFMVNIFVAMFLFWELLFSISKEVGYKPYDKWPALMAIGICVAGSFGGMVFPFKGSAIGLLAVYTGMGGTPIDFGQYMLFMDPTLLVMITSYVLICRFVFRPDVSLLSGDVATSLISPEDLILNKRQKFLLIVLLFTILLLLVPNILPTTWTLTTILNSFGASGKIFLVLAALMVIHIDGQPVLDFQASAKNIDWSVILMVGTIFFISSLISNEATGISTTLAELLRPMVNGLGEIPFILAAIAMAIIFTQVANNGIICIIFMTLVLTIADAFTILPASAFCVILMVAVQISHATPVASPFAACLFANTSAWVKVKDLYKYGLTSTIIMMIIMMGWSFFWGNFIF